MYERFTDRARKVMQLANQEAQRFNHEYIGTEHILLGLIREGSGVAANVLKNLDLDLRKIRLEVEKIVMAGPDMVTMGRLPQTPRARKVIEYSIEEARNLNHNYVGTEHLLLGLLREHEGVAAQVLMNLGLTLQAVRDETMQLLGGNIGPKRSSKVKSETRKLPPPGRRAVKELEARIQQLEQDKERAVAEQDFNKAAELRDQGDMLKKEREALIRHWSEQPKEKDQTRPAREFELYLPLHGRDGTPVGPDRIRRLKQHILEHCAGALFVAQRTMDLTMPPPVLMQPIADLQTDSNAPIIILDQPGPGQTVSTSSPGEFMVLHVLAVKGNAAREFFQQLKEELKAELQQDDVLIVEKRVRLL